MHIEKGDKGGKTALEATAGLDRLCEEQEPQITFLCSPTLCHVWPKEANTCNIGKGRLYNRLYKIIVEHVFWVIIFNKMKFSFFRIYLPLLKVGFFLNVFTSMCLTLYQGCQ